jgi:hypothetical protein
MAFPPFSGYYKFRGWFYLWPFCWVSLTAKKKWLARRWVEERNPTKDIGMLNPSTNKPWLMLEPSPKFQTCFGH